MDSRESTAFINKEEKMKKPVFNQKLSVFDPLSKDLQRYTLSFLVGNDVEKSKSISSFSFPSHSSQGSFLFECSASLVASAVRKAINNLAHRIKVNETLEFIQKNTNIFQPLPFSIEIIDRCGRRIIRNSIIGALVALDEFDVIEAKAGDKPCSLISTVFSWFNKAGDPRSRHIKNILQRQLEETSGPRHVLATKERRKGSLHEIEILINKAIGSADISNDSYDAPFEDLLNQEFIQNFIKNAFNPDPNDNGEWGVVWDFWQLYLDYIYLLSAYANNENVADKSRPNLGGLWSRKTEVIDTAVFLAFLRSSQFCHLEVSAKGFSNVSAANPPVHFDCSKSPPDILAGIGSTHFFGFFSDKYARGAREGRAWERKQARRDVAKLFSNKNISIKQLMRPQPNTKSNCLIM